jgi:hypothetical protein
MTNAGIEIRVSVLPRSSRSEIIGIHDGALKLKLTRPPVDGAANEECCRLIAHRLGVPKSAVSVCRGSTSRRKVLLVQGIAEKNVLEFLDAVRGS